MCSGRSVCAQYVREQRSSLTMILSVGWHPAPRCATATPCSGPAHALLYLKAGRSTHADWVDSRVADPTEPTGKWKAPRSASKACTAGES